MLKSMHGDRVISDSAGMKMYAPQLFSLSNKNA